MVKVGNNVKPAPDELLKLLFCSYKNKCCFGSFSCVQNSLPGTDACTNQGCESYVAYEIQNDNLEEQYELDNEEFNSGEC